MSMEQFLEQDSEKLALLRRIESLQEVVCELLARNEQLRTAMRSLEDELGPARIGTEAME
ncbi:hypothetical protein SAMN05421771_0865 [Granulicella pectinivorans]|uniref:Uncharacterized protein n=1 Tax=Granulicella pectinivorans TaxID=474950 RepID=A0A1I6LL69_9BACT|nr:hypothetical protein [Granulicella pectinivorans]SFS04141.1 hypothetical protein SAMN05421771_0865 [Granulicella pectinivorans]